MINVVYAANDRVFQGLILSSTSLLYNNKVDNIFILTLSDDDFSLSESSRNYFISIVEYLSPKTKVTFIDCTSLNELILCNGGVNRNSGFTPLANLRLLVNRVIDLPNVLYLDCDTIVDQDISDWYEHLINIDIDLGASWCSYLGSEGNELVSGIVFFNLKKLPDSFFNNAINFLINNETQYPDQKAIEYSMNVCNIKTIRFEEEVGYCKDLYLVEPQTELKIIHFTNQLKKVYYLGWEKFFKLYPQYLKYDLIIKKFQSIKNA